MSLTLPLRRLLLQCLTVVPNAAGLTATADLLNCAELLLGTGEAEAARLLYDAAFLQSGFSPQCLQAQAGIAARTKLWGEVSWAAANVGALPRESQSREHLWARLSALAALVPETTDHLTPHATAAVPDDAELPHLCSQLCAALRQPASEAVLSEVGALLAALRACVLAKAPYTAAEEVAAEPARLAQRLAANALRGFMMSRLPLIVLPAGSLALFHAAARFDSAGLGPYFIETTPDGSHPGLNEHCVAEAIRQFLRGDHDASGTGIGMRKRGLLLPLVFHDAALRDVVDELDAAGIADAIRFIFARMQAAGASQADPVLLEHIRDAGLNSLDFDLARCAQRFALERTPGDGEAWIILGDIEALAGNRPAAEAAYHLGRRAQLEKFAANGRLDALRDGRYGVFQQALASLATKTRPLEMPLRCYRAKLMDHILRTSLLRLALNPSVLLDQIDCAELAFAAGHNDAARILYDVIFIASGFSAAATRRQQHIEQRLGLWEPIIPRRDHPSSSSCSPGGSGLAVAHLKAIMADAARVLQPMQPSNGRLLDISRLSAPFSSGRAETTVDELHAFCNRLRGALRQPPSAQGHISLREQLTWLERHVLSQPPIDPARFCQLDITALALAIAFNILRDYAISIRELAFGPWGSAEIFHASARLEEAGLGPYFSRTTDHVSDARDLFGFIQLCTQGLPRTEEWRDALERWSVLLSAGYRRDELHALVDALADLGLMRAIRAIALRAGAQGSARFDPGLMWLIRDAALDNNDLALAAQVQRLVTHWRVHDAVEWTVLGEIEATAGNAGLAADAFNTALTLDADHRGARERLDALEANRFEPFRIEGGFGTSPERKVLRQSRLQTA